MVVTVNTPSLWTLSTLLPTRRCRLELLPRRGLPMGARGSLKILWHRRPLRLVRLLRRQLRSSQLLVLLYQLLVACRVWLVSLPTRFSLTSSDLVNAEFPIIPVSGTTSTPSLKLQPSPVALVRPNLCLKHHRLSLTLLRFA